MSLELVIRCKDCGAEIDAWDVDADDDDDQFDSERSPIQLADVFHDTA
mgnify:CR=1 FL=1